MIEILQDNDDAGKQGAVKIAKALHDEFGGEPMIAKWDESLKKGFDPRDDDEALTETKKALKNFDAKLTVSQDTISVHLFSCTF